MSDKTQAKKQGYDCFDDCDEPNTDFLGVRQDFDGSIEILCVDTFNTGWSRFTCLTPENALKLAERITQLVNAPRL